MSSYKKSDYFSEEFIELFTVYTNSIANERTAAETWGAVRVLCDYLKKDFLDIDEKDSTHFFDYMASRASQGTLKCTTINSRKSIYNRLCIFLNENYPELGFGNPFAQIRPLTYRAGIKPSKIPSLSEIDAVLEASKSEPMYYLILSLAFRAALTATNIISLRQDNIQKTDKGLCIHFTGKHDQIIPLPNDITILLSDYMASMTYMDKEGHLFYNKYNNPLTLRNLDKAVEKYIARSGIEKKYTLQDLRSRAILDMLHATLEHEGDVKNVASYVGIRELRLNTYVNATTFVEKCPADLVNLAVKPLDSDIQNNLSGEEINEW